MSGQEQHLQAEQAVLELLQVPQLEQDVILSQISKQMETLLNQSRKLDDARMFQQRFIYTAIHHIVQAIQNEPFAVNVSMLDLLIVLLYFAVIMVVALRGRNREEETSVKAYFLSNGNLRWPSVAMSTIATNIQGYQFLGMMGSAYLYGLAQANLEINAVQGILLAAFLFVPLYLKEKVITITQFIERKVGPRVALAYSLANLTLFSTITLGAALFWGSFAAERFAASTGATPKSG